MIFFICGHFLGYPRIFFFLNPEEQCSDPSLSVARAVFQGCSWEKRAPNVFESKVTKHGVMLSQI